YDGTDFCGWQRQHNGLSVQQVVEEAMSHLPGLVPHVVAAGRTDAGVHASGQVISFWSSGVLPVEKLPLALNSQLPPAVAAQCAEVVGDSFHATKSCLWRRYSYRIYLSICPAPLIDRFAYRVPGELDLEAMRQASAQLLGQHDFSAFATKEERQPVKKVLAVNITTEQFVSQVPVIKLTVMANGFLRGMMRGMAGTLLEVGKGERPPDDLARILKARDRRLAGPNLPAKGLCLEEAGYPE
ncbi:MAG: tRNA pseudouridine(38-40) synthase TruA, partial [Deinococcus sp.]|nr:tRNA pseudouridine(38-40) synthase TruA [Deinococcus sp.]